MLYEKATCPVCGGEFTDGDDVVVCPVCGTPHHRGCWESTGRCANEGRHGEHFVWAPPRSAEKDTDDRKRENPRDETAIVCPNCGASSPPDTLVCPECGTSFGAVGRAFYGAEQDINLDGSFFMHGVNANPNEEFDGIRVGDAAAFVQSRAPRYIPKFIAMSRENKKTGWNWAAFFLTPYWFFYRKLYKAGAFFLGMAVIVFLFASIPWNNVSIEFRNEMSNYINMTGNTTVDEYLVQYNEFLQNYGNLPEAERAKLDGLQKKLIRSGAFFIAVRLIPGIFAALFSDNLYKTKTVKDVKSMRSFAKNDKTFLVLAMRRGGVSLISAFGCLLLVQMLLSLLSSL